MSQPSAGDEPRLENVGKVVANKTGWAGNDWYQYRVSDYRVMSPEFSIALRHLYDGMEASVPAAYEKGKADGSNLLAMLNSGHLTKEFERRAGIRTE